MDSWGDAAKTDDRRSIEEMKDLRRLFIQLSASLYLFILPSSGPHSPLSGPLRTLSVIIFAVIPEMSHMITPQRAAMLQLTRDLPISIVSRNRGEPRIWPPIRFNPTLGALENTARFSRGCHKVADCRVRNEMSRGTEHRRIPGTRVPHDMA